VVGEEGVDVVMSFLPKENLMLSIL
jgi:hypothetical protein